MDKTLAPAEQIVKSLLAYQAELIEASKSLGRPSETLLKINSCLYHQYPPTPEPALKDEDVPGTLPAYETKCPVDSVKIHFEQLGGMRVYREIEGKEVYSARCPECGRYYHVLR